MSAGCDGPFRVRVLVPADPAIVRVPVPTVPAVVRVVTPGPEGAPGKDGAAASVQTFPIAAVASFTAAHGLSFAPRVWLVDAGGVEVEADIHHAPGQVTAVFAQPFTGTLYLG